MGTFEKDGLAFGIDREGIRIEGALPIEVDVDYDDLKLDYDRAPEMLSARLSRMMGERVEDDEGIFDLIVTRKGQPVATIVISCEEDCVELGGERVEDLDDQELANLLVEALME